MEEFIKALTSFAPELDADFLREKIKEEQRVRDEFVKKNGDVLTLTYDDGTTEKIKI